MNVSTFNDLKDGQTITREEWESVEKTIPFCYQWYTSALYDINHKVLPTSTLECQKVIEGVEYDNLPQKISVTIKNK